jgi:2-oxoglutarate dehydrogenase E2 component (dihydrolipoamide succinyltransferase)
MSETESAATSTTGNAAATVEIRAPADQTEGTRSQILRWLRAIGDRVREHEPLIEIETDKVTVEVAAPASGVLREILKGEQEEITPGEVLGRLGPATGAGDSREQPASAANVTDDGADRRSAAASPRTRDGARTPKALSPAVRRLLAERGLEPAAIRGSGEGGRITVDDVLAHVPSAGEASPDDVPPHVPSAGVPSSDDVLTHVPSGGATSSSPPQVSRRGSDRIPSHSVPHSAIRKRIAEHMVQSLLHTAPHVTTVFEADMSAVIAHREAHRSELERRGTPLTFTAYFVAAAVEAIRAVPEANSRWTDDALEIYDAINIGVATAVEEIGLVVPVLHSVGSMGLFEIARSLNERVAAARAGRLQPADVRGGTFTLSNHGVSGSLLAAPIVINQPQSAILGIGKLEKRLVVVDDAGGKEAVARPKCYVTLTIDHRVMDGHQANRFLQRFVMTLAEWPAP